MKGQNYTPVGKKPLFVSSKIGENLEGLCLGPTLPNGNRVLLGVVDNGDPISKNTLVAFELADPAPWPMAAIYAAAGGGALILVVLVIVISRRRQKNAVAAL